WLLDLLTGFLCPFVKAIGQDQAAAPLEGSPEGWFAGHCVRAGIDEACPDLFLLGPGRNQAPPEESPFRTPLGMPHRQNPLCRRDVITRLSGREIEQGEKSLQRVASCT